MENIILGIHMAGAHVSFKKIVLKIGKVLTGKIK